MDDIPTVREFEFWLREGHGSPPECEYLSEWVTCRMLAEEIREFIASWRLERMSGKNFAENEVE